MRRPRLFLASVLLILSACGTENRLETHVVPPVAVILAPSLDALFRQSDGTINLLGEATDSKDGPPDLRASWSVDVGEGVEASVGEDDRVHGELDAGSLEVGTHLLTLRVEDSDDASTEAIISFVVEGPLESPTVEITAPSDGASFDAAEVVTFQGTGSDSWTPAGELVFAWSSDRDGDLAGAISADGNSVLVTSELTEGFHTITLDATDGDGHVGADSIDIIVAPQIVQPDPGDLVFSEMMINPDLVNDEVGEWVELYNTSGSTLDIGGYTFRDDDVDAWVLAGPLLVQPHDFVVLCADLDPSINGGVDCDGSVARSRLG